MIQGIDHVVILVHNLQKAIDDYRSLGFTVTPGGEHADGATHNALIAFADGTYIELVAFLRPAPEHFFYRQHGGEGLITFALLPGDIERDIEEARTRGLDIKGPLPGGRLRPDGQRLEWRLGIPSTPDLPFLCGDVTPRDLRVPGGDATKHSNGVTGMGSITVAVNDIGTSVEHYRQLLGTGPALQFAQEQPEAHVAAFHVGNSSIALIEPGSEPGPMRDYLEVRGEGPYTLALHTANPASTGDLDIARTHDARITFIDQPEQTGA
jgi:catechol 2,3-dioxygenase-like lactoylglutathione lyase family enzyme